MSLIVCPYCDHDNFEGADVCEKCQHSLAHLSLPRPATVVERSLLKDRVGKLETKPPLAVAPDAPVADVLKMMVQHWVGCAVVVEGEKIVGVFTERDALNRLGDASEELGAKPVSEFMTKNPQTLKASARIAFAVRQMDLGGYRHVPIVDEDDHITGVVSVRDILQYLTDKMAVG